MYETAYIYTKDLFPKFIYVIFLKREEKITKLYENLFYFYLIRHVEASFVLCLTKITRELRPILQF